jgi:hypothetical protein
MISGEKYKGYFDRNFRHGKGVCSYRNGARYAGEWYRLVFIYMKMYVYIHNIYIDMYIYIYIYIYISTYTYACIGMVHDMRESGIG